MCRSYVAVCSPRTRIAVHSIFGVVGLQRVLHRRGFSLIPRIFASTIVRLVNPPRELSSLREATLICAT